MLFFALMDAVLKQLTAHYPVMQIAALRGRGDRVGLVLVAARKPLGQD
jgi:hypothetical protein